MEERLLCAYLLPRFLHLAPGRRAKAFDICLKLASQERKDSRTAKMVPRVQQQALQGLLQLCLSTAKAPECRAPQGRAALELVR